MTTRLAIDLPRRALVAVLVVWFAGAGAIGRSQNPPGIDTTRAQDLLRRQRAAVRERVREPYLLETSSFKLFLDRRDATWRLEDGSTSVSWHGPLDRRGAATLLLASGEREEDGEWIEYPLDRHADVRATSRSIRFRALSSRGEIPRVDVQFTVTSPLVGLEMRVDLAPEIIARGGRVRLLERALWIADADTGGLLVPAGLGEWHDVANPESLERTYTDAPAISGRDTDGRLAFAALGLKRQDTGMIVSWDRPGALLSIRRVEHTLSSGDDEDEDGQRDDAGENEDGDAGDTQQDRLYPGSRHLELSLTLAGEARAVRFYPLGHARRQELTLSCRQLVESRQPIASLRTKSGVQPRLRSLIGAAILRCAPLSRADRASSLRLENFLDVQEASLRLRERLGIDRALFVVEKWHTGDARPVPRPELGGVEALRESRRTLREGGHLLALTTPLDTAASREKHDFVKRWIEAFEDTEPDLVLLREANAASGFEIDDQVLPPPEELTELAPLAGGPYGGTPTFRWASLVELPDALWGWSAHRTTRFPFLPAVHGRHARLVAPPRRAALGPGDEDAFLAHLILGEVPVYRLDPEAGDAQIASPLSRDDGGWYSGSDIPAAERFLKTTYEVATHVARLRQGEEIHQYRKLTSDGAVEEIYYGFDLRIVVNRGDEDHVDPEGRFVLPPGGFWVQHPFFLAFHARKAFGETYQMPALFTLRSLEGRIWVRARKIRLWHAFGPSHIRLAGKRFEVPGELITSLR